MECQCSLRTRLVGDGCEVCNPSRAIEYVAEERIELLRQKYANGRWTPEEAARFETLNAEMNRLSPRVTPEMLKSLRDMTEADFDEAHGLTPNKDYQDRAR